MSNLRNDPRVAKLAAQGSAWAKRLMNNGWGGLRPNQKAAARQALGILPAPVATPVATTRLVNGNPTNQRRKRNQPGNLRTDTPVTSTEFFADVLLHTGEDANIRSWVINPREVSLFPRLSIQSALYDKYRISSLRVRFASSCSFDVNGKIMLGFIGDSSDEVPVTKIDVHSLTKTAECTAMQNIIFNVGGDNITRFLGDRASDDPKLVNFGRIVLCTYGFDSNAPSIVGELSVEYTITLLNPSPVASLSQRWISGSSKGIGFVEYTQDVATKTYQFAFQTGGRYCLIVATDKGVFGSPLVTGSVQTQSRVVTDGTATLMTVSVDMKAPNGTISWVPPTDQGALTEWIVTRV
uniref:Capsid protein n=1 Tax=Angelonia flower mottle virus TaxID=336861 RepID=Q3LB12_9TOMB|nr:coat protein [Angelonia flower mottle virus]